MGAPACCAANIGPLHVAPVLSPDLEERVGNLPERLARKLYLWDWSSVEADGPRFENMLACQLLKYCHWVEDTQGYSMELRYLRDTDKREVDFVVLKDYKPLFAVECKSGETAIGSALRYFAERTPIPRGCARHIP